MGTRGRKKNPAQTAATRNNLIEKSYELFSTNTIESVTMSEIAKASGYGEITLYRYFPTKPMLVIAAATWKWEQFQEGNRKRRESVNFEGMTAVEIFEFYLDSFLQLYKNNKDLLRFNQFFNVYVQSEHIEAETLQPYQKMIDRLKEQFHGMYLKAQQDKTLRTDEPEEKMFSKTLHLMLAVVTRYAVGLVYVPESGFDAMEELKFQKNVILKEYKMG